MFKVNASYFIVYLVRIARTHNPWLLTCFIVGSLLSTINVSIDLNKFTLAAVVAGIILVAQPSRHCPRISIVWIWILLFLGIPMLLGKSLFWSTANMLGVIDLLLRYTTKVKGVEDAIATLIYQISEFDVRFIQDFKVDFCVQSPPQARRIAEAWGQLASS
jgi:hypothetical protein